ncbi:hypothetical protein OS493_023961 [Desmophyllum pertusum]|uniref:Uncharacterized protein n=1 Tax=Desmophyllum pertusum TaxID=174260 RepID=A0A9W9ZZ72_9CNID|nr:hypothetical protein OS493_023961 [Desmophyllum pertusum]
MADRQQVMVISLLLAAICYISCARECVPAYGYQSCACYMEGVNNTKEYVNLLSLKGNSSTPRFTTKDDKGFYLSFSPCDEFSEFVGENNTGYVPCVNATVARWTKESTHRCESLGDEASGTFKSDAVISDLIKSNLTLNFKSAKTAHHSAVISLVCNDSLLQNETIFKYVGTQNIPTDTYYLSLTSLCCCPGKCGFPPVIPSTTAITPTATARTVSSVIPNTTAPAPTGAFYKLFPCLLTSVTQNK